MPLESAPAPVPSAPAIAQVRDTPSSYRPSRPSRLSRTERLGDEITELAAHITAATYRLLTLLREFDDAHGWHAQGAKSCAHWLHWRTGIDLGAAREKVRVAHALEDLPLISTAMRRGELSYSKVRALTRVATHDTESDLLVFARSGTTAHVETLVRSWRRFDRQEEIADGPDADPETGQRSVRHLHRSALWHHDEDGMLVLHARLDPEEGALLVKALEAAEQHLFQQRRSLARAEGNGGCTSEGANEGGGDDSVGPTATIEQRQADALALVAESALGAGLEGTERGDRYQVLLHVHPESVHPEAVQTESLATGGAKRRDTEPRTERIEIDAGQLESGFRVSAETSKRLCCSGSQVAVLADARGQTLDVGRKTRTIPSSIRRALRLRDGGCRFPGCTTRHCDAHHVTHWSDGGHTRLDNLLLLCRRHHRAVHEEGFGVDLGANGDAHFRNPQGVAIPEVPQAPSLPARPVAQLVARNSREGLEISASSGRSSWDGRPLSIRELHHTVRYLHSAVAERAEKNVSAETSLES